MNKQNALFLLLSALFTVSAQAGSSFTVLYLTIEGPQSHKHTQEFKQIIKSSLPHSSIKIKDEAEKEAILTIPVNFASMSFRDALSSMRAMNIEAQNCTAENTSCLSNAINQDRWNEVNFGSWHQRANVDNVVGVYSRAHLISIWGLSDLDVTEIRYLAEKYQTTRNTNSSYLPIQISGFTRKTK